MSARPHPAAPDPAAPLLQTRALTRHFGGLRAVDQVDFTLDRGQIHALIGPNGAGKTTFVSLLCGRVPVQSGQILFGGRDITAWPAHRRVRAGIAYTFQITAVYPRLSVFDNLALAVQARTLARRDGAAGLPGSPGPAAPSLAEGVDQALAQVGLLAWRDQLAGALSYGHQRLLELAMGLALAPRLLILDEPTQGLANAEIAIFKDLIRGLVPQTTVLLIEHNMDVVMDLAQRITVLEQGRHLATGSPAAIRANPAVQAAYLGAPALNPAAPNPAVQNPAVPIPEAPHA